jgi:hypothetical protein
VPPLLAVSASAPCSWFSDLTLSWICGVNSLKFSQRTPPLRFRLIDSRALLAISGDRLVGRGAKLILFHSLGFALFVHGLPSRLEAIPVALLGTDSSFEVPEFPNELGELPEAAHFGQLALGPPNRIHRSEMRGLFGMIAEIEFSHPQQRTTGRARREVRPT